jgi:hypothetical protein
MIKKMTELNLQIEFNREKHLITIDPNAPLKTFFNYLRETFKKNYNLIANEKLLIFYGNPLKKLFEHEINFNNTLADLQIANNSHLRVEIDDENYIYETLMQNPDVLVEQQKALDEFAEIKNSGNYDNLKEHGEANSCYLIPGISNLSKEEKKEERKILKNIFFKQIILFNFILKNFKKKILLILKIKHSY